MTFETRVARIDRFAGWSDRSHPAGLTRIENPKLLNIDFSERKPRRRFGCTRLNTERLTDGSIRLDGINDYLLIKHQTSYQPTGANMFYVGIGVVLRKRPASRCTIVMKGHTAPTSVAGDNTQWRLQYNSVGGTGSLGCWTVTAYDNTAGALRTITLDDGDGGHVPEDQYRFIEFWVSDVGGTPTLNAKLYKPDGTTVTGTPATLTTTITSAENIVVGVPLSAAATVGTEFANATVMELRFYVGSLANILLRLASVTDYGVDRTMRELNPNEAALYLGYWKLQDGNMSGVLVDSGTGGNNALIPANPASWVRVDGVTLGQSSIQFFGHDAFAALWDTSGKLLNPFITTSTSQTQRWTVRGIFSPKLATGESTVRDQTIFWAGTNATIPAPVGLRIISDVWTATYRDGASTVTRTLSGATFGPTALVNKQVRFALSRYGGGNGFFRLALSWKDNSGVQQQTFTDLSLVSGATPDTSSGFWFLGRHVTSVTLPYTYGTAAGDGGAFGIIDDFQVVHTNAQGAVPVSHGNALAFTETSSWGGQHFVVAHMKMNEGGGNFILITSEIPQSMTGFLYPEENDGAHWDIGYVRPYRSPECGGLFDFNRFLPDGTTKRTKLVNSGCTWSEFDTATGVLTPIGAAPKAATKWTKDQYAQTAFLAADNGQRPVRYDGTGFEFVGIRAPLSAPVLTDAAGGTFTGVYYFYVTFYNKTRNVESNPGPGVAYTYSSRQITAVTIPTSPDPQVTGRRLYVSLANGSLGSLAFLLQEFDDNTQVVWTSLTTLALTAITAPVTSGRVLDFFEREEPPNASIVKVFGDNLFVAGNPVFPTRLYRSSVLEVDYFNQEERFVDFDLDSGDPITGMKPLVDSLFVGLRDGWGRAANTGDTNDPISRVVLSRDHGPAGPHAIVPVDRIIYYLSERDIFRTDGLTEENVSSPPRADYPSIQHTMKTGINPTRRASIVGTQYKGRKQLLFAYSTTDAERNDRIICYDMSQGVFSDYELAMDFITELENEDDDPTLYGVSEGYICELDTEGIGDGVTPQRLTVLTQTAGTCPFITYSGAAVTGAHGSIAFCLKRATQEVLVARCEASDTGLLRFYSVTLGLAANDIVIVGGIRMMMRWLLDFGESIMRKRLRALYLSGKSSHADTRMRLQWAPHQAERNPSFTTADQSIKEWPVAQDMLRFEMGGLFRTVLIQLSESDDAFDVFTADPWVSTVVAPPVVYELAAKAEVMNVE